MFRFGKYGITTEVYFFSYLVSFFIPQVIDRVQSPLNGPITIELFFGSLRMVVGGYWQSGRYVTNLYKRLFAQKSMRSNKKNMVLLLGLAGGSALPVIYESYPNCRVTAIEKDPVMVALRNKYFPLHRDVHLRVVVEDAQTFVFRVSSLRYQCIINDLYIACDMPLFVTKPAFLHNILSLLTHDGHYMCNASYIPEHRQTTDRMILQLQKIFPRVVCDRYGPNMLITAYRNL